MRACRLRPKRGGSVGLPDLRQPPHGTITQPPSLDRLQRLDPRTPPMFRPPMPRPPMATAASPRTSYRLRRRRRNLSLVRNLWLQCPLRQQRKRLGLPVAMSPVEQCLEERRTLRHHLVRAAVRLALAEVLDRRPGHRSRPAATAQYQRPELLAQVRSPTRLTGLRPPIRMPSRRQTRALRAQRRISPAWRFLPRPPPRTTKSRFVLSI